MWDLNPRGLSTTDLAGLPPTRLGQSRNYPLTGFLLILRINSAVSTIIWAGYFCLLCHLEIGVGFNPQSGGDVTRKLPFLEPCVMFGDTEKLLANALYKMIYSEIMPEKEFSNRYLILGSAFFLIVT